MQCRKLFITGASGSGKSYIINKMLGGLRKTAGGFRTVRLEQGGLRYVLVPSSSDDIENDGLCFLDYRVSPPTKNEDVFSDTAVQLLKDSQAHPFALIDETGGYELLNESFSEALYSLLRSELPIIAVIKGRKNAAELNARFSLGSDYDRALNELYSAIEDLPDGRLVEMKCRGDATVAEAISEWMEQF